MLIKRLLQKMHRPAAVPPADPPVVEIPVAVVEDVDHPSSPPPINPPLSPREQRVLAALLSKGL